MAPELLLEIEHSRYRKKTARTIAILVLFKSGKPHRLVYCFSDRRLSMHASRSTHKQGECLLVLGDLLFGQRIGLYAGAKLLSVKAVPNARIAAPQSGVIRVQQTRAEQERGHSGSNSGDARTMVKDRGG